LAWVHASSVGEGLQARATIHALAAARPDIAVAYTWFSPSAEAFAATVPAVFRDVLPFDTPANARAALAALAPAALAFVKLDVWPALTAQAARRGVRLALLSGTVAPDSTRLHPLARALTRDAYAALDAVGAISADDAERLITLGARRDRVRVTGDARYDQVWERADSVAADDPLLAPLRCDRPTVVAGSTWPADERVLGPAWERVAAECPTARLVLVPHEPTATHAGSAEAWARGRGWRAARLGAADAATDVIVVDRVGVLGRLYALADAAVVGGGFHAAGLHSVLEPAAFGAPVAFGPRHANSREAGLLVNEGGARVVGDAGELAALLRTWLTDRDARDAAGAAARAHVARGRGAAARNAALLAGLL
jgi:3-deoxy-D-manno-octulosonic-acid transferase